MYMVTCTQRNMYEVNMYSKNLVVLIESSTRRYRDEEIDRVFCYFEDGMQTAKISKLLDIPRQTVSH